MKLGRMNHIGVAVPSITDAIAHYRDVLGAQQVCEPFSMEAQGVTVAFVNTPGENGTQGTQVELIEPYGESSPIHNFLKTNPLGGQHHICYEVPDLHAAKAEFEAMGKRVLGEPRIGAHGTLIFFLHPKDMGGILTEIMETPKDAH